MSDESMVMSRYNVVDSLVPSVNLENRIGGVIVSVLAIGGVIVSVLAIGGVIVSVLASSAVDRWFQP
jgi:hypothetical protein